MFVMRDECFNGMILSTKSIVLFSIV